MAGKSLKTIKQTVTQTMLCPLRNSTLSLWHTQLWGLPHYWRADLWLVTV